jgi:hypothetical protein
MELLFDKTIDRCMVSKILRGKALREFKASHLLDFVSVVIN